MTTPDHNLTPPDPEPLSPKRKAELRARLLSETRPRRARDHRWLVPALTAAAVLGIVAAGGVIVGTHGGGSTEPDGFAPAGGGSTAQSDPARHVRSPGQAAPSHSAPSPSHPGHSAPGHDVATRLPATVSRRHVSQRSGHVRPPGGLPGSTSTCEQEIRALGRTDLDGSSVTADRGYSLGTTSLYETKTAWVVCDTFSTLDGGAPTLFSPHAKDDAYQPSQQTLQLSENFVVDDDGFHAQFLAAGRDFDGVQSISYTFPDGHVEDAVVGQNGLWTMNYLPTSGPLADQSTNETTLAPVKATVTYTDGSTDTFSLQWGLDTCAQVNHGC